MPLDTRATPLDIAVIIVTYKSARLTIDCLKTLTLEREHPKIHVRAVVVDNASGDFAQIAEAIEVQNWTRWVSLVSAPINGGFAYGNNLGIKTAYAASKPDYVYLLNPDTQVRPGAILTLANFLEKHVDCGIAGGTFENLDGSDDAIAFRFPNLISEVEHGLAFGIISRMLKPWMTVIRMSGNSEPVDWVCGASMMIRPSVLATIGGLDENYFLYFEETDFCWRAKQAGFDTWYVPESRVMHIGGQSTSVTQRSVEPKRFPAYWFESRRRFFVTTCGVPYAIAIDFAALLAHLLGSIKRTLQFKRHTLVPNYIEDLIRFSVLWPRNRKHPAIKSEIAAGRCA